MSSAKLYHSIILQAINRRRQVYPWMHGLISSWNCRIVSTWLSRSRTGGATFNAESNIWHLTPPNITTVTMCPPTHTHVNYYYLHYRIVIFVFFFLECTSHCVRRNTCYKLRTYPLSWTHWSDGTVESVVTINVPRLPVHRPSSSSVVALCWSFSTVRPSASRYIIIVRVRHGFSRFVHYPGLIDVIRSGWAVRIHSTLRN